MGTRSMGRTRPLPFFGAHSISKNKEMSEQVYKYYVIYITFELSMRFEPNSLLGFPYEKPWRKLWNSLVPHLAWNYFRLSYPFLKLISCFFHLRGGGGEDCVSFILKWFLCKLMTCNYNKCIQHLFSFCMYCLILFLSIICQESQISISISCLHYSLSNHSLWTDGGMVTFWG